MKKNHLLTFVILFVTLQTIIAQNTFYILNTKGAVKLKKTGVLIKVNDQISDKDILLFSTPTDAVAVISTKNGRMILKPKPNAKSSELVCVVSEILNPGTGRLSARAGLINNVVDLNSYFNIDSLTILGATKIWVSPVAFPMNQDNFFFVRYTWKGETINKKVAFDKDSLILNYGDIYKVDGKDISPEEIINPTLFYKKGSGVTAMCPFTISFPDENQLKETISTYKKYSTQKGNNFIEELMSLLKDVYGKTDKDNVRSWVNKNIGVY